MRFSTGFLSPSEAARRLGISVKALRLYERRGLMTARRTAAGWRIYGPDEMGRAADIVTLRTLGFSLAEIARMLAGNLQVLEAALAAHQTTLEARVRHLAASAGKVRELRDGLAGGRAPDIRELAPLLGRPSALDVAFDLPWPWGGERFELGDLRPLTYITGPLGSGKTRLARCLAAALPDAAFLGLERLTEGGSVARAKLAADPALETRVDRALAWLVGEGGAASEALISLLIELEAEAPSMLVVDMLEQGLDRATQEALSARLRRRGPGARPLFVLTRSTAILDLDSVSADDEAIVFCPANHSMPLRVTPWPGAPGYEALASCLATPEVRARSQGIVACRR